MRIIGRYCSLTLLAFIFLYVVLTRRSLNEVDDSKLEKVEKTAFTEKPRRAINEDECTMEKCFDFTKCKDLNNLKVFVYPDLPTNPETETHSSSAHSEVYSNILRVIRESRFYTNDSSEACLFILNIDTIDRDKKSQNYVQDISHHIEKLPKELWNGGKNHIIFNLYHGTWPDYADQNLGFDTGHAMVGRASSSTESLTYGFDFGFPLFHPEHPIRTASIPKERDSSHKYMVSFKGKRYVYGIGSETRDSLHHLHNGNSSVMVTTCRHNNDWKKFEDSRCAQDNDEYEKWDYKELLINSTFCLTPRGRRLGSFRFLETLRAGCIPVVLSDDWELPFSEVINWSEAALTAKEKNVLFVTDMLWDVNTTRIEQMRKRGRILYHKHFSSVEKIVTTTFQMIFERIRRHSKQPAQLSIELNSLPHASLRGSGQMFGTEAVILCDTKFTGRVNRIVNSLNKMDNITSIVVLWPSARGQPPEIDAFQSHIPLSLFVVPKPNAAELLNLRTNRSGDFVMFIDERVRVDKRDFIAMRDAIEKAPNYFISWHASSQKINNIPIGLIHFAAIRRSILAEYDRWIPTTAKKWADEVMRYCHTVMFNLMVADLTMTGVEVIGPSSPEKWMKVRNYTNCSNTINTMLYDGTLQISAAQPNASPAIDR